MTAALAPLDARAAAVLGDATEAAAYADLYAAAPPRLAAQLGLAVHAIGGATVLVASGIPAPFFNRAIGLGLERPATVAGLAALEACYRAAGVASWWLHWSPYAAPAGFADDVLAARGYAAPERRAWVKVLRPSAAPPAATTTSLTIEPVADEADASATGHAIAAAFELPPVLGEWIACLHERPGWSLLALRDGDRSVGGAARFRHGEACWLGIGGVLPSHRRRGGQGALIARRIADAALEGVPWVTTETGLPIGDEPNPSLANMRRAGFVPVAERLNLAGPA